MPAGPHVRLIDRQVVAGGEQVSGGEAGDPGSDNGELHTPVLTKRSPIWLNERVGQLQPACSRITLTRWTQGCGVSASPR